MLTKKTFVFGNEDNIEYLVSAVIVLAHNTFYCLPDSIEIQKDIDRLQIAFNNVKLDFEEMQKYE